MSRLSNRATVSGPRAAAIQKRFEIPVLVAALLVVPVIVVEEQADSNQLLAAAQFLNWLI